MTISYEITDSARERIAILKAVPCPGRTHPLIKNPRLRHEFAMELNDLRNQAIQGGFRHELSTENHWKGVRYGLESGFWAMQKAENRAFIYEGRRVVWGLVWYAFAKDGER